MTSRAEGRFVLCKGSSQCPSDPHIEHCVAEEAIRLMINSVFVISKWSPAVARFVAVVAAIMHASVLR